VERRIRDTITPKAPRLTGQALFQLGSRKPECNGCARWNPLSPQTKTNETNEQSQTSTGIGNNPQVETEQPRTGRQGTEPGRRQKEKRKRDADEEDTRKSAQAEEKETNKTAQEQRTANNTKAV
jgi:hypothetical protein